jgi:xanthine dehydrogenase small subunit
VTHWIRPTSLAEALAARAEHPGHVLLAGGTDLMVGALERPDPEGVIDLFGLPELVGVSRDDDGRLRIGAGTTYARLLAEDAVRRDLPALWAAAREVGALQIQSRGTIGGNIGTSSPVGDTLPVLLALDAELELASATGVRHVAYEDFCTGYRTHALRADELITAVRFPSDVGARTQVWRKVGTRRAQSISKVMFAASVAREDDGRVTLARLALGAVREVPIRARAAEALLEGATPDGELADRVAEAVGQDAAPIDDVRSRADYRRAVARRLVRRFVLGLATKG